MFQMFYLLHTSAEGRAGARRWGTWCPGGYARGTPRAGGHIWGGAWAGTRRACGRACRGKASYALSYQTGSCRSYRTGGEPCPDALLGPYVRVLVLPKQEW